MSDYRRYFVAGGIYFFTLVTHQRRPIFSDMENVRLLREAVASVKRESPFTINAAVVLPDHLHFIWSLPSGDADYSKRIGLTKVRFTRSLQKRLANPRKSEFASRRKHRECDVWQRRFWEHTIEDEGEFDSFLDYIHFNPVRHGLATCPHSWPASSFHHWVRKEVYDPRWGCCCDNRSPELLKHLPSEDLIGEPND